MLSPLIFYSYHILSRRNIRYNCNDSKLLWRTVLVFHNIAYSLDYWKTYKFIFTFRSSFETIRHGCSLVYIGVHCSFPQFYIYWYSLYKHKIPKIQKNPRERKEISNEIWNKKEKNPLRLYLILGILICINPPNILFLEYWYLILIIIIFLFLNNMYLIK